MNTRKLIIKVSYGLVAALFIVLVGLLVYQQRRIQQMAQNEVKVPPAAAIPDVNNTPPRPVTLAEGGREKFVAEVDELRYQLEASEEELKMAREDLANRQGFDIQEANAIEKRMKENPTLMNMRRRESENFLNQTHGALFERLGLTDEKLNDLKTLLVDFHMQVDEVSIRLDEQSLSDEEKKEMQQQLEDQKAEFKRQAKELLGAENYEAYEAYEERQSERLIVSGLINPLSVDLGLSDEKEQALIDAMYEARKEVEARYHTDSSDETHGSVSQNDEESKDRTLKRFDGYIESAKGVLSGSQAEQFETRMNEWKEMVKMTRVAFNIDDSDDGPQ